MVPSFPPQVIQRGVRSLPVFTTEGDRHEYLRLLREFGGRYGLRFWAWCLMTNHVHLVVVPTRNDSVAHAIGEAPRRSTRFVNFREGVRGPLFQARFHAFPIQDDRHLLAVVRYVECNPVRAGLVRQAVDYPWSSACPHARGTPDPLISDSPLRALAPDGDHVLQHVEEEVERLRRHVRTDQPWGTTDWLEQLEQQLGRPLRPRTGGWPKGRPRRASHVVLQELSPEFREAGNE